VVQAGALGLRSRPLKLEAPYAASHVARISGPEYPPSCMDTLTRIKRLVVAQQVEFTAKADQERLADGLTVEDVLESILNANAIKKVLRSHHLLGTQAATTCASSRARATLAFGFTPRVPYAEKADAKSSMSSPRRNSPTKSRKRACPVCSKGPVVDVVEDVVLRVKGRKYRFENIKHELCTKCGERIFDLETSRMFDEKILTKKKSRAA